MLFSLNQPGFLVGLLFCLFVLNPYGIQIKSYQDSRNRSQPFLDMTPTKEKLPVAQNTDAENFLKHIPIEQLEKKVFWRRK